MSALIFSDIFSPSQVNLGFHFFISWTSNQSKIIVFIFHYVLDVFLTLPSHAG